MAASGNKVAIFKLAGIIIGTVIVIYYLWISSTMHKPVMTLPLGSLIHMLAISPRFLRADEQARRPKPRRCRSCPVTIELGPVLLVWGLPESFQMAGTVK